MFIILLERLNQLLVVASHHNHFQYCSVHQLYQLLWWQKKKLLVFVASLLNILCGKTFFLFESMMQKCFKSLFSIHSLQNFVVDNRNIELKKPHRLLFSLFWPFFFGAISWLVKYDYVMFSLARSRSEFACSPSKGQFPLGEFIRAKRKAARLFSKRKSLFNFHYTAKSFGAFFIYHLKKKTGVGRWLEFLIVKNC